MKLVKLSQYNSLIQSLGYPEETLGDLEGILTPGTVSEKNSYRINGPLNHQFEVLNGKKSEIVKVLKAETFIAVPATYGETLVVSDRLYDDAFKAQQDQDQEYGYAAYHTFFVQDWKNTGDVSRAILDRLNENEDYSYYVKSLYMD